MEWAFSVEKRQNGGRLNQRALRVPLGSFQDVLRKDLEVDLERTQNYCVELFALYLRRMIVEIQFTTTIKLGNLFLITYFENVCKSDLPC